jgi:type II secretory pathway pseudopilin PulG
MMYPSWLNKHQSGFTVIEAIVALAITGFLGVGIFTALYQVRTVNNIDNARVTAVKQVENAVHHINRDVQMAQKIDIDGTDQDGGDYWLKLTWTSWEDNVRCKVLYRLEVENLERQYWEKPEGSFTLVNSETVARHISLTEATAPNPTAIPPVKSCTIKITSTAPSGPEQADETREIVIIPRPGS